MTFYARFGGPPLVTCWLCWLAVCPPISAHEKTRGMFLRALAQARARADAGAERVATGANAETCRLTIKLVDNWSKESVPGLVRVTNLSSGKAVKIDAAIHRALNWFALEANTTVLVPRARVRIEAVRGLKTKLATRVVDLTENERSTVSIDLEDFYETRLRGIYSGNTHVHLMNLTHAEADRYLRVVPRVDNLDLVFLSHLRRVPDERNYITNVIVENSFTGGDLRRLSQDGVLMANGQEHRHNFGPYGEGYGHVMLLNLRKLIRPISIGPGIMRAGTDGRPLQRSILAAREDGATVIWCHNKFGLEDLPNWASGLVHAQNIFDGGAHGSYTDTFYRYLNLGIRVPFSTGTDWTIYDFARAYVTVDGDLTAGRWLEGLRDGKSYITNGPFLELETERAPVGGTLHMNGPNQVTVVGRGMGRLDFGGLELVHNGKIAHRVRAKRVDGYHVADLRHALDVDGPGWFALRIPLEAGKTELDRPLFGHTSPIYIEFAGREVFHLETAERMVDEMRSSLDTIDEKGEFANRAERMAVREVYQRGIAVLDERIRARRLEQRSRDNE